MKNRINNILIGLLWLLAATLGASFWFNTQFGFNVFSLQHWQYLAYMQASGQPVKSGFYISLVVIVAVTVFILYQLLQPHFRHIALPVFDTNANNIQPQPAPQQPQPQTTVEKPVQTPDTTPQPIVQENTQPEPSQAPSPVSSPARPPRLNIPASTQPRMTAPRVPLSSGTAQPKVNPEIDYADIHEIFKSAGFVYKGAPRIKNVQTSIVAIGTDEVLWLGATGVKTGDMQIAVDTLNGVFADTLDDIEINVNAFIIGAPDANENANGSILQFASVDDLRAYIESNPNTPPDEDEIENFDAYSGYIGTVVDYIGKI